MSIDSAVATCAQSFYASCLASMNPIFELLGERLQTKSQAFVFRRIFRIIGFQPRGCIRHSCPSASNACPYPSMWFDRSFRFLTGWPHLTTSVLPTLSTDIGLTGRSCATSEMARCLRWTRGQMQHDHTVTVPPCVVTHACSFSLREIPCVHLHNKLNHNTSTANTSPCIMRN